MTTTVFSIAPALHQCPALVCQLQDTSPQDAIKRLEKSGVLAIEGVDPASIVLIGFNYEVSMLISDLRRYGKAYHPRPCQIAAKIKRLALAS
jgi:hypothetical protein